MLFFIVPSSCDDSQKELFESISGYSVACFDPLGVHDSYNFNFSSNCLVRIRMPGGVKKGEARQSSLPHADLWVKVRVGMDVHGARAVKVLSGGEVFPILFELAAAMASAEV